MSETTETGSEEKEVEQTEVGIRQAPSGKFYGRVNDKAHAARHLGAKQKNRSARPDPAGIPMISQPKLTVVNNADSGHP